MSEKEEEVERLAALTKAVARGKEAKAKEVRKWSSKVSACHQVVTFFFPY